MGGCVREISNLLLLLGQDEVMREAFRTSVATAAQKRRLAKGAVAVSPVSPRGWNTADNTQQEGKSSEAGRTQWICLFSCFVCTWSSDG